MLLTRETLPETIADVAALDELLCRPSQALIDDLGKVSGDIMILGVAGKMGPTLAGLAKAALPGRRVIGVARFSETGTKDWLQARGVETINCDLLDEAAINALIASRARQVIVVADSSKLGQRAFARVCPVSAMTTLVTDDQASAAVVAAFERLGVRVLLA